MNLLYQYGGLWLDSTILVTEPLKNHKKLLEQPFFTQKFYQEKDNSCHLADNMAYGRWAGFIQGTSILHNPLFAFEKDFFAEYWRDFDEVIDYVLMDFMMELAYENNSAVRKEFDDVPINNTGVWHLLSHLNAPYAQFPYDKILPETFLHKLNWRAQLDMNTPDTVFREIQRRYAPETN